MREMLADQASFEPSAVHTAVESFAAKLGVGMGDVAQPLRVAVSGGTVTPPLEQTLAVLGKEEVLKILETQLQATRSKLGEMQAFERDLVANIARMKTLIEVARKQS